MGEHDTLFKRAFSVPEHASGELRSVLPESITAALDLSRLELVAGSFVDAEMAERHTDLLFRAPIAGSTKFGYIYFLLEHQSEPDAFMPLRVLEYMVRVWDAIRRSEPERTRLPPVVTIVVHNGARSWEAPRSMHELVELLEEHPELAPFVPSFELLIDDLAAEDDEALSRRPLAPFPKVALWLLRDTRDVETFLAHLVAWGAELERLARESHQEDIDVVVRYILRVAGETPYEVVQQRIAQVAPAMEDPMATAAEQLVQKGIEKGIERGIEKGIEKGTRATLVRLLRARFGPLSTELEQRIEDADTDELDRALDQVLTARRAEDVFDS